jgi:hypothetical protein
VKIRWVGQSVIVAFLASTVIAKPGNVLAFIV